MGRIRRRWPHSRRGRRWLPGGALVLAGTLLIVKIFPLLIWPLGIGLWLLWAGLGPLFVGAFLIWLGWYIVSAI